jgi:hypothetical protein
MSDPAARAVVSDDGSTIWLTAYTASGDAVSVVLLPVRAVAVAHALLAAAIPMLACREKSKSSKRGGDPRAEQRRRRDEALCDLHNLTGEDKPLEAWSRDIARRLVRFRPMPVETDPERRLVRKIKEIGLPIGRKRIKEIVAKQ